MITSKRLVPEFSESADPRVAKGVHYYKYYEQYFEPLVDSPLTLLELGVYKGDSLEMFARYFENGLILGVDADSVERNFSSRIKFYQGLQDDSQLYARMLSENNLKELDIVIDDCSHIGSTTLQSFKLLFPLLKNGGYYIIEDWSTGYWPKWPGGQLFDPAQHMVERDEKFYSHPFGIPGFIKQLVDEVAMPEITNRRGLDFPSASHIEFVHVYQGLVFIKKLAQ